MFKVARKGPGMGTEEEKEVRRRRGEDKKARGEAGRLRGKWAETSAPRSGSGAILGESCGCCVARVFSTMENAQGQEWNSTEAREKCGNYSVNHTSAETSLLEDQHAASQHNAPAVPGTSAKGTKRKKSISGNKEFCPKKKAECSDMPKPQKKVLPIPPIPDELPPINLLHRDTVRAWCQQLHLSTKGQKLEVYKRLCTHAFPNQKDIPSTAKEAKIQKTLKKKLKVEKKEMSPEDAEQRMCSQGTDPPAVVLTPGLGSPPEEGGLPVLESASLLEGVNTVVVTTSAPETVLASWARIAARAGSSTEAVESPKKDCDVRWCVVHGKSLPADTDGWVHLQFHAGQAWVPEKKAGKVSALFLLPACNFPPPHLEDNMLCPKCVHRNKALIKSLRWE
ncbi:developmental pluripotency-associated protein 4 [Nycticebus coucang]|uniref:developmental pluripotency-associated protein 4 n=1 Tax=Nycticebus coucang TaxID=9470 RepID=UPI00234D5613|nr:developmental pluripotency-associated protein 4 [Nycticebus coucang]